MTYIRPKDAMQRVSLFNRIHPLPHLDLGRIRFNSKLLFHTFKKHLLPQATHKYDIKWRALVMPPCVPLTVETSPPMPSWRGMAPVRIAQGFQFILGLLGVGLRKSTCSGHRDDYVPESTGPADVLQSPLDPVYAERDP
jgi:hypothetical protein